MRSAMTTMLAAAALAATATAAAAQGVPDTVSFSGRLSDANGPIEGAVNLRFRLFDQLENGTAVWDEDHPAATAAGGLIHVALGGTTPLDAAVFDGGTLYLDIAIDGTSLTPRAAIHSVPYAIRAGVATAAELLGPLAPADVQRRVTTVCGTGMAMSAIAADGTATCVADNDSGGDITGITTPVGSGLTGGVTSGTATLGYDPAVIQTRVGVGCTAANQSIKSIAQNGTVTCETDDDAGGDITGVTAGTGLTGGGTAGTVGVAIDGGIVARKDAAAGDQSFDGGLLYLSYAGNFVGILDASPSTALDVNGTTTSTAYAYRGTQIGYAWASPASFARQDSSMAVDLDGPYWEMDDAGGVYVLYAPVHLPDGSTITELTCWYFDNNALTNASFSFDLLRTFPGTAAGTSLAPLFAVTAGANGAAQSVTGTVNTPVNNAIYNYYVFAQVVGNPITQTQDSIQFRGCQIQYTYQTVRH